MVSECSRGSQGCYFREFQDIEEALQGGNPGDLQGVSRDFRVLTGGRMGVFQGSRRSKRYFSESRRILVVPGAFYGVSVKF